MTETVRRERQGPVAVLVIDNPPVNALSGRLRSDLHAAFLAALADPAVKAIVLRAEGRGFSAGADVTEFGKTSDAILLPALCSRIELSPKPVIAALHGPTLGGGLELALAAHVRLAAPGTRLGLPEVALGILPGAGGTQRTPRLVGAKAALQLMLTGRPVDAVEAQKMGLIDAVVETGLVEAAVALAAEMAGEATPPPTRDRRDGMTDALAYQAAVAAARKAAEGERLPAPLQIVACVEAAQLLPFEQGLAFERAAFEDLVTSPEAAGLRHAFLSERRAARFPEAGAAPRPCDHVALVGLGRTGTELALALIGAGLRVTVADSDRQALIDGLERVAETQERAVAEGRMTAEARDAAWARLEPAADLAGLGAADLVIDCVPEAEKPALALALAGVMRPGAVIATSSVTRDVGALGQAAGRAADVVGMIFARPLSAHRLTEIAVGPESAPEAVATVAALARRLGRLPLRTGAAPGQIVARVTDALMTAAEYLTEDGATPAQVDAALRDWGFDEGPFEAADRLGLDRALAYRLRPGAPSEPAARVVELADLLMAAGRKGRATGAGYHRYAPDRQDDPDTLALLEELRAAKGIVARRFTPEEIRRRCLAAMANEGARLVGEGVAQRPSDVDVAMVAGAGFPRHRGGPMFWAAQRGPIVLRSDIRAFADQAPAFWQVAPLVDDLIRTGRTLAELDAQPA